MSVSSSSRLSGELFIVMVSPVYLKLSFYSLFWCTALSILISFIPGYAMDPSVDIEDEGVAVIGDAESAEKSKGMFYCVVDQM